MEDERQANGLRMLDALSNLQVETHFSVFASAASAGMDVDYYRSIAWKGLLQRIERGELIAYGCRTGGKPEIIHSYMLDDAQPDYTNNRLTCCGTVFFSIRVLTKELEPPQVYQSGVSGRPTSRSLIVVEMERRHGAGLLEESLAKEAAELSTWLQATHPQAPQMIPKTIEEAIRTEYRELNPRK